MITEFLSKSIVRRNLLSLLFSNPERRYYQRQLEKTLECAVSAVRRELLRLEREGLVRRVSEANIVFFRANSEHPLYAEVSAIIAKTIGIPAAIAESLGKWPGIALVILFGSYARYLGREKGVDWTAQSDIDLLVIGEVDLGELSRRLRGVESRFQRSVNPTIYRIAEFLEKLRKGNDFLADVFHHHVIPLIGWDDSEILTPQRLAPAKIQEKLGGPESDRRPRERKADPAGKPQPSSRRTTHGKGAK